MKMTKLAICGGLLTAVAWNSTITSVYGQCACAGQSVVMGEMISESSPVSEAEALLSEVDDPSRIINLTVIVQDKAIVMINGEPTFTKGTTRPYIVRGLKSGRSYSFKVEGLLKNESGAEYYSSETVELKAGDSKQVVLHLRRRNRVVPPPAPPTLPPFAAAPAAK
jgi:uncharacterized protein (TIGR03000 family)